jgi:type IV pilus assembly protein PilY1
MQSNGLQAGEGLQVMAREDIRSDLDTRTAIAILVVGVIAVLALTFAPRSASGDAQTMADYAAFPPFMSATVEPNVLVILDNSGSMNEFAYKEVSGRICTGAQAYTGYQEGSKYFGYFDPDTCYKYDNSGHYFYPDGPTVDDPATPGVFERSAGFDAADRKFSGNWLNWWTTRRLDVAKRVLTGGRLASDPGNYVLLATPTERDYRRIFNDYTAATDPYGVATKNVYYTPFRQGIYAYFFNVQRNGEFTVMFKIVEARFDDPSDLTSAGCANTDPDVDGMENELTDDPSYGSVGEPSPPYAYPAYFVAVKAGTVGTDRAPEGIVQQMADRVRFGYMQFNLGYGPAEGATGNYGSWDIDGNGTADLNWGYADGGRIRNYVGDKATVVSAQGDTVLQIVDNINRQSIKMWTPLEEVVNEALRYYRQQPPCYTPDYPDTPPANNVDFEVNATWDPYYYNDYYGPGLGEWVPCAKSFIILITDGEPNQNSGAQSCGGFDDTFAGDGNGLLDDLGLLMNTTDQRPDLPGMQTVQLYTIFTFEVPSQTVVATNYLKRASRAGAFQDMDGDGEPYCEANCGNWGASFYSGSCGSRDGGGNCTADPLCSEWDRNCDGAPDTFFYAPDGDEISYVMLTALTDILRRSASGTAVSILSTSAHGEGSLFQAYFKPQEVTSRAGDSAQADWLGFLHGLWVDDHGNLREDNGDFELVYEDDNIIQFYFDGTNGTRIQRDYVSAAEPYGDGSWDETNVSMNDLRSMWEAGKNLALRDLAANPRKVFTTLDKQNLVEFDPSDAALFKDYLRSPDAADAEALMDYILGEDQPGMRPRTVYVDTDGDTAADTEGTWRLGDIIYSTPAVVGRPMENYDEIYSDPTYDAFERQYTRGAGPNLEPRPTVVYVGANDGMLHAINAGCYKAGDERTTGTVEHGRYTTDYPAYFTSALGRSPELGEEIWSFVPHNLLPHLQWLADPNYMHVYYVDLKPKTVDARIFPDDATHPNGWGTVLIGALRYGGKNYEVDDFNQDGTADDPAAFSSCYFALDVTNPGDPRLLWEFNDPDHLGLTSSYPAVARTGRTDEPGDWYVIFGSGPTDYDGSSSQRASIFVLNLRTGNLERRFGANPAGDGFPANPVLEQRGWVGGFASMDMNLDYQTNAIYAGASYEVFGIVTFGKMYRILIGTPDLDVYPPPASWEVSVLSHTRPEQPIVAPPAIASDHQNTPWIYWGTGRFFNDADKVTVTTQSFYGVKDRTLAAGNPAEGKAPADLLDVTNVEVSFGNPSTVTGSTVVGAGATWDEMLAAMRGNEVTPTYGWVLDLVDIAGPGAGERVLEKPSVLGGLVMFSSFKPNNDICQYGGDGRIYGLYFETGTAYKRDVFSLGNPAFGTVLDRSLDLGQGRPSGLAIHLGQQKGGKIYVQQSTGTIEELVMKAPFAQKSGTVLWYED